MLLNGDYETDDFTESHEGNVMNPFKKTVLYNMCKTLLFYSVDSNTGPTKDRKWLWTPPVTPAAGVQARSVFMLAWFVSFLSACSHSLFSVQSAEQTLRLPAAVISHRSAEGDLWPLSSWIAAQTTFLPLREEASSRCASSSCTSVVQEWSLKPEGHHGNCILKRRYLTLYLCVINANDGSKNQFETALNSKLQINLVTLRERSEVKQDMMF